MFENVRKQTSESAPPAPPAPPSSPASPAARRESFGLSPKKADTILPQQAAEQRDIPEATLNALKQAGLEEMETEPPSRRFLVILLAAALVLIVVIAAVFLFANPFAKKENTNTGENTNGTLNANGNGNLNTNANTNAHVDWKTYRNALLGFSIDYPPTWTAVPQSGDSLFFDIGTAATGREALYVTETTQDNTEWLESFLLQYDAGTLIDTETLSISGFPVVGIDTHTDDGSFYSMTNGTVRYIFQTSGVMRDSGMLETFRFITDATNTNATNTNSTTNGNTNANANGNTNAAPIDTDRDGLTDAQERELGTNPLVADTDSDGVSDYHEIVVYNSSPTNPDTDGDGYTDGDEIRNNYNPVGPGPLTP